MKSGTPALFFLSLIALIFSSCGKMVAPELVAIENVKAPLLSFKSSVMTLDLHCFNPNKSKVKFKSAHGEAWVEGKKLGNFRVDTSLTIQAKADFWLPVTLEMETKDALKNAAFLLLQDEVLLKIDGKARLGKSGIYINYPIKYEGKQPVKGFIR